MKRIWFVIAVLGLLGCQKSEGTKQEAGGANGVAQSQSASVPKVSREPSLNATPLGVEIGFANLAGVKNKLGGQTKLIDAGTSDVSGGMILVSDGQGLGVDGLSKFIAVFDKSETLVAVVMTLPKDVNGIYAKLADKYHPVEKRIDEFMGNGTAKLEKGDSFVVIEVPHMSFTMDVAYATKVFLADAQRTSSEAQIRKEQEQKNKL